MQTSLYVIEDLCKGQFAIMPRPSGYDKLDNEIEQIRDMGFDTVVSLLTPEEQQQFGLEQEAQCCHDKGLAFLNFPIVDEIAESDTEMVVFLSQLLDLQQTQHRMLFHCHSSAGRSSAVLSLLADRLGICPDKAFESISSSLGFQVPETPLQKQWVRSLSVTEEDMHSILPMGNL